MKIKQAPRKIGKKRITRDWTLQEEKYLKYNYGVIPAAQIAEKLSRSKRSIWARAFKLGLTFMDNSRPARLKHDRVKIKYYIDTGLGANQIASVMGTNPRHIRWVVKNEFEDSYQKKLIRNGKENYREYRRKAAISRATAN